MINQIKIFFNEYRDRILVLLIVVCLALVITTSLNAFAKRKKIEGVTYQDYTQDYGNDRTIMENTKVDDQKYTSDKNLILEFTNYCNTNPLKAYSMLGKASLVEFPSYENFKNQYVELYFKDNQTASPQAFTNNVYLVELREDIMASGVVSDAYVREYISIPKDENNKVNIAGIVEKDDINAFSSFENLEFTFNYIMYKTDYAVINVTVSNYNNEEVNLDVTDSQLGITGVSSNNLQFNYINGKTPRDDLVLLPKEEKTIELYIPMVYDSDIKITGISFSKIQIGNEIIENKYIKL